MNYSPILAPVVALVAWTLVVMLWMFVSRLREFRRLGVTLDKAQLDEVYTRFVALADRKKGILDEEIRKLASEVAANNMSRKIA